MEENKTIEMMLKNVREFGEISYNQEKEREKSIMEQSSWIFTAFSIFFAVFSFQIFKMPKISIALIFSVFTVSLILATISKHRYIYDSMQSGEMFYEKVCDKFELYQTQDQFDYQIMMQFSQTQKSKRKNNDKRVRCLMGSMISFVVGIVLTVILICVGGI